MLLEADSAAEGGGGVQQQLQDQQQLQEGKASGRLQWQQDVLRVLRHIKTLSLSPGDAPALLSCCTELQCLLATASDWGYLQDWLYTSPGLGTGVAGPAPLAAAAASMQEASSTAAADVQLQPVLRRSLGSSRTCSTAGQQDSPAGALSQDLRAEVLQTLLRLVDSKKPDVLVKVRRCLNLPVCGTWWSLKGCQEQGARPCQLLFFLRVCHLMYSKHTPTAAYVVRASGTCCSDSTHPSSAPTEQSPVYCCD